MVRFSQLLGSLGGTCVPAFAPEHDREIRDVHVDSRRVVPDAMFAALPGLVHDGARFVPDALERGASAVLSPERVRRAPSGADWLNWVHPEARRVAGEAAAFVHDHPTRSMGVVGITGTNGKTTVAHMTGELLAAAGRRPAVIGTVGYRLWGAETEPATHTTPDATELQRLCARNRANGGDAFVLEVSSHALDQERTAGLELDVAVFTNLTHDHIDYHGDFDSYASAKAKIFRHLKSDGAAAIHADDPHAAFMRGAAEAAGARVVTFGTGSRCDLQASRVSTDQEGIDLFLQGMGISRIGLTLPLVGRHNLENALAATAASLVLGASPSRVLDGLATISTPRGRLERVDTGARGFHVFVDYAHTPDALECVLATLRDVAAGRLLVAFGCGGERDAEKRAPMGAIAARIADAVVVTSDNPRGEDPDAIVAAVLAGAADGDAEVEAETDRRAAIRRALELARPGDVVLIAGKGHESWQELRGRKLPFDDRSVVEEELRP